MPNPFPHQQPQPQNPSFTPTSSQISNLVLQSMAPSALLQLTLQDQLAQGSLSASKNFRYKNHSQQLASSQALHHQILQKNLGNYSQTHGLNFSNPLSLTAAGFGVNQGFGLPANLLFSPNLNLGHGFGPSSNNLGSAANLSQSLNTKISPRAPANQNLNHIEDTVSVANQPHAQQAIIPEPSSTQTEAQTQSPISQIKLPQQL